MLVYLSERMKISKLIPSTNELHTSSNGLVSAKQLSQTSLTAFSAASVDGQAVLAATDITALRLTHAW